MARYNAKESEKKWQEAWSQSGVFLTPTDSTRSKCYVLEMFPYPSGRIHIGHVRNYTMGDVIARFKRAQGFNVLHPMGWDAFGLPAENAAREKGVSPRDWTYANIAAMKGQLKLMGLSIDWSREFATCDPAYYRHEQKLFLDFYREGLVYRSEADVNWDPVDQTVLANEQVIDGKGWRSGAPVERRKLSQWFFKITAYLRRSAGGARQARTLAGKSPPDAEELDRPLGRSALFLRLVERTRTSKFFDAPRHIVRRQLRGAFARSSVDGGIGDDGSQDRSVRRRVPAYRHRRGSDRESREAGLRHRP